MQQPILAPSCIGILGGGQLGMMLARVAKQFGYQVAILEPDSDCPAKSVADIFINGKYDDVECLDKLAQVSQVITTEFENVPAQAVDYLSTQTLVYPQANALLIAQNRIKEKTFFRSCGLQTAEFAVIASVTDCNSIAESFFPAILKTTTLGYDGKGQRKVSGRADLLSAFSELGGECILEQIVDLSQEMSIIIARNATGCKVFPLIENQHRNGILDVSYIPANANQLIHDQAHAAAIKIADGLNYTGLLTIEFFITNSGDILVNEMAPRPHNSGHITIEAAITSQFEQQLRAVCNLPLGSTNLKSNGAMLNLLGDVWLDSSIIPEDIILAHYPDAKYHTYGKKIAKSARKMGHLSLCDNDSARLQETIVQIKTALKIV